jgi:hypothetical protein
MDSRTRRQISYFLKDQLDRAQNVQTLAVNRFGQIVAESPGSIPSSDGNLLVKQAGVAARDSLAAYSRALKRYTDFTASGVVPEDLDWVDNATAWPRERYRISRPTIAMFCDPLTERQRAELIPPETILTIDSVPFEGGKMVNVTWNGKRAAVSTQDLRLRAKPEPEP